MGERPPERPRLKRPRWSAPHGVRTFFTVIKGTPSARQASGPRPGSCGRRGQHAGSALDGRGCRAVGGWGREGTPAVAGGSLACRLSTRRRTARAAAAAPLPRTCHPPGCPRHAPRWPRLQEPPWVLPRRACCRRESPPSRALRPAASASLASQVQTLDGGLPRQDWALAGRPGESGLLDFGRSDRPLQTPPAVNDALL